VLFEGNRGLRLPFVSKSKGGDLLKEVLRNSLYRHFKGKLYYVIGEVWHSETMEEMVVYHALYGDNEMWVRPKAEFLSEVEEGKPNPTGQRYRFEPVEG
jgi:hypothetical protein